MNISLERCKSSFHVTVELYVDADSVVHAKIISPVYSLVRIAEMLHLQTLGLVFELLLLSVTFRNICITSS